MVTTTALLAKRWMIFWADFWLASGVWLSGRFWEFVANSSGRSLHIKLLSRSRYRPPSQEFSVHGRGHGYNAAAGGRGGEENGGMQGQHHCSSQGKIKCTFNSARSITLNR